MYAKRQFYRSMFQTSILLGTHHFEFTTFTNCGSTVVSGTNMNNTSSIFGSHWVPTYPPMVRWCVTLLGVVDICDYVGYVESLDFTF